MWSEFSKKTIERVGFKQKMSQIGSCFLAFLTSFATAFSTAGHMEPASDHVELIPDEEGRVESFGQSAVPSFLVPSLLVAETPMN
jgi:hypothetical protein